MGRVIAILTTPKQRATRPYSTVLMEEYPVAENVPLREDRFSVHRVYEDDGSMAHGSWNLTAEKGWEVFKERVNASLGYGPGTWEHLS